ncbi:MAG: type II toxin-antitoxin system Phd/YefM family antitoxin [Thermoanaerobaculia bacterium]
MKTVNVHVAKTNLSKLLARVEKGEEIVIGNAGRSVARLVPLAVSATVPRNPGNAKGQFTISKRFDTPLPKRLQRAFEGEDDDLV